MITNKISPWEKEAQAWYEFGVKKLTEGCYKKAIEFFRKALLYKDNYKDSYELIGKASKALEKPKNRVTLADQWLY